MSKTYQMAIQIGAALSRDFGGVTSEANKALGELAKRSADLSKANEGAKAFAQLKQDVSQAETAVASAQTEVDRLVQAMDGTSKPTKAMRDEMRMAQKAVRDAEKRLGKKRQELDKAGKALRSASVDTGRLALEQRRLQAQLAATQRRMAGMAMIAKANLGKNIQAMGRQFARAGGIIAGVGVAAGAGIFALAKSTADSGDEIAKTAKRLSIGVEELQELRYAAERSGMSIKEMDNSVKFLNQNLGKAATQGGTAARPFRQLGINARQLEKMAPEDQIALIADRLKKIRTPARQAAIAQQIFGKSADKTLLILREGSGGLKDLRQQARDTGNVLGVKAAADAEDFQDALLDIRMVLRGLKNTFGSEFMPVITSGMRRLQKWVLENRDQIVQFARTTGVYLKDVVVPAMIEASQNAYKIAIEIKDLILRAKELAGGWDRLIAIGLALWSAKTVASIVSVASSLVRVSVGAYKVAAAKLAAAKATWAYNAALKKSIALGAAQTGGLAKLGIGKKALAGLATAGKGIAAGGLAVKGAAVAGAGAVGYGIGNVVLERGVEKATGKRLSAWIADAIPVRGRGDNEAYMTPITPPRMLSTGPSIDYHPTIQVEGNANQEVITRALQEDRQELVRLMRDAQRDERRLSYD